MSSIEYVLVTGATGFIGAHVVDELLRRGLRVRAAARSHQKADALRQAMNTHASKLDFVFIDDLTTPGVFDDAVKGVDAIIHTASPLNYTITDPEKDLIIPAIQGTKSIFQAAKQEPRIKRIVLTSSFAAVLDNTKAPGPDFVYTSEDWNPITYEQGKNSDAFDAYRASKKFAELAAWDVIRKEDPQFDLVTICPPMVFGPVVDRTVSKVSELSVTVSVIWGLASGKSPFPGSRVPLWVDVRDLAYAHVEALVRPEVSNKRFTIASPELFTQRLAADIILDHFDWAKGVVNEEGRGALVPSSYHLDGETIGKALGVKYKSFKDSIVESVAQLREIYLKEQQS